MQLRLERRAEIAFRSLSQIDRRRIEAALHEISSATPGELTLSRKLRKLLSASGEKLYVYRGSKRLRIVFSILGDECIIEDIVDHDRLDRLLSKRGQQ